MVKSSDLSVGRAIIELMFDSEAATVMRPKDRLEVLFDELAELTGQRNAIDARIVEIAAEMDRDRLIGITGARSMTALIAWKTGISPANAATVAAIADRLEEFPLCAAQMRQGRLSLDQVGVIATRGGQGCDAHYVELAQVATVTQLRTAVKLEPRPDPEPAPANRNARSPRPPPSTAPAGGSPSGMWRRPPSTPPCSHTWTPLSPSGNATTTPASTTTATAHQLPPFPHTGDAFMALIEAGWDTDVTARPHGQHTTVVVHLDVKDKIASLHLGPLLSDADRQYLTCDATCEVWFHRDGQPLGAGRTTRTINRRLRRALEYRHPTCAVPGCGATRGLHAHHMQHWEDGGPTDLDNLVLVCPYHHRLHHRGGITITGPADSLTVTDSTGRALSPTSLARPPNTPPPTVAPCRGPLGERADWRWYTPFETPASTDN